MKVRVWLMEWGESVGQGSSVSRCPPYLHQRMGELFHQSPQRCWRKMKQSSSCRSSWRRGAGYGSCSSYSSFETAGRR